MFAEMGNLNAINIYAPQVFKYQKRIIQDKFHYFMHAEMADYKW